MVVMMTTKEVAMDPDRRVRLPRLRAVRQAATMSQDELAFRCGVSQSRVSLLERGYAAATERDLAALSAALGCGPEQLAEAA